MPRKPMRQASARTRDFYDFYRAMQSYQTTFIGDGQDQVAPTNIILSPQNDYLKEFSGRPTLNWNVQTALRRGRH